MKRTAAKRRKTEGELLDQATGQLLRAVKQKLATTRGHLDYDKLKKDGFSGRFLAKLEQA